MATQRPHLHPPLWFENRCKSAHTSHVFLTQNFIVLLRLFSLSLDHDKIHKIGERCRSMCRRISCVQRRVMGTAYSAPSLIRPVLSLLEDSKQELFQFLEIKDKSEIIRTEHISCYSQYTRKRKEFCWEVYGCPDYHGLLRDRQQPTRSVIYLHLKGVRW